LTICLLIASIGLNLLLWFALSVERGFCDHLVLEILLLEEHKKRLRDQVEEQQDAIHEKFCEALDGAPGYTKGPWHNPDQLNLL
jgi:hypothetical protein